MNRYPQLSAVRTRPRAHGATPGAGARSAWQAGGT